MKIDFILSDTTKRATTMALKTAVKNAEADKFSSVIVLVPETKSIIIEKELLSLTKYGATTNVFVYSFVRLLSRMGKYESEKMLSKQACVVIIRKIIFDNIDKFVCYKKTAKSLGFAEKIYDTIAQFKSSNISPDEIESAISNLSEALKMKLSDILLIYREYENCLGSEFFDDCDRLALIKNFAKTSELLKNSEVFVVGFDNITFEMESVLKELAVNAKHLTFSSVFFNKTRGDSYIQKNELYSKFKHIADELKQPYVPAFYKTFESGDFHSIANSLFLPRKNTVKSKGNVKILEAHTKNDEIEFVANTIMREVLSGKKFKDIGLFVCGLDENYSLIEKCFKRFNIPFFINKSHDISGHLLVKFFESAFNLVIRHLSASDVLSFVSNPLFGDFDTSSFFNFVRASGTNYSSFLNEPKFEFDCENDKVVVFEILERLKNFYVVFEEKVRDCQSVHDYILASEFLFDYFSVKSRLVELSEEQKGFDELILGEITAVIFEKHEVFAKTLLNFMGTEKVSASEFLQIYLSGFGTIKINLSPVAVDCVIIQDNTDGFFDIKDLFIFDATDGKFPFKIEDKGIILDSELEETKNFIKNAVEPTVQTINIRENFRVYEALLEPKEKLFVSYSLKSDGGVASKPAQIISKLIELFGKDIVRSEFEKCGYVSDENAELEFSKSIGKYLATNQGIDELNEKYSLLYPSERFESWLEGLRFNAPRFEIDNANDLYFFGDKTSISQLEKYFSCPYEFFGTYGLRIKENKDFKLSSLDIGTVIHRVVELFGAKFESFKNLESIEFENEIDKLLKIAIEELKVNTSRNRAVLNLMSAECKRLCAGIIKEQQASSFKLNKTEFSFGETSPVLIELSNGRKLALGGKIDRIDKMGEYIRIVDYKTGDVKSNLSSVYFGKKIQLASYLEAVKKLGNAKPAGLFYLPVHSDYEDSEEKSASHYKMQGFLLDDIDVIKFMDSSLGESELNSKFVPLKVKLDKNGQLQISRQGRAGERFLSGEDFENLGVYVLKLASTGAEEILSGYIEPSPLALSNESGLSRCIFCEFAGYCNVEKSRFSHGRKCDGLVDATSFDLTEKNKGESDGK